MHLVYAHKGTGVFGQLFKSTCPPPDERCLSVVSEQTARLRPLAPVLEVEAHARANQLLPEVAIEVVFSVAARILEVVVFDEGAQLRVK